MPRRLRVVFVPVVLPSAPFRRFHAAASIFCHDLAATVALEPKPLRENVPVQEMAERAAETHEQPRPRRVSSLHANDGPNKDDLRAEVSTLRVTLKDTFMWVKICL